MSRDPLHTQVCDDLGIEVPIFGFSHCKDVVAELCNAGGVGFMGGGGTLDELAENINWIRERVGSRPFGIDLIFPSTMPQSALTRGDIKADFPEEHRQFMRALKEEFKLPDPKPIPGPRPDNALNTPHPDSSAMTTNLEDTRKRAQMLIDMKVPLMAAGLGSPGFILDLLRSHGIKVFSLVGNVRQAKRVAEAGVDYVVASGHDAAGHCSEIGTFSVVPQIVDAVSPTPVLAAGGVASGRQLVAALALGAIGVWTGTIWLPTRESGHLMSQKQALLDATERDTVRTRVWSGKPGRFLRNAFTDAWERPGAPKTLLMPWQSVLVEEMLSAAFDYDRVDLMRHEASQSVGLIKEMKTVRQTVFDLIDEAQATLDRIGMAPA